MSDPAQIGKSEYNAALVKGRNANTEIVQVLRRIVRESRDPIVKALAGDIAMSVHENNDALNRFDEIGRKAKNLPAP
jgi:hypothetical protein